MLFETNGFGVVAADTCDLALRQVRTHRPDVCIVDLGLPDEDGITFIKQVRTWSPVPVIVLTARVQETARLRAFEAGVDDYVNKPFSSAELLARVRAIMRRVMRPEQPKAILLLGNARVDLENRITHGPSGASVKLTRLEHRILECLVRHAEGVVTHSQILKEVWGPHQSDVRSLRVYVASLRRKLEVDPARPQYILTEAGIGYRLSMD
jgi:two-component system KDP operon response regulator KdpE